MARLVAPLWRVLLRVLFLWSLLLCASCTKPTVFPRYLTVADVINNVKCELYLAISENPKQPWLDGLVATLSVSLEVVRQTGASGDLTLVVPYHHGLFTVVAGGAVNKSGKSRLLFDFTAGNTLGAFMLENPNPCDYWRQHSGRNNLAGETGLRLWYGNLIQGLNQAKTEATGFTYTLEFVTTLDGHIKPSFETMYPSGRIFSGDFSVDRRREDTNILTVAFAKQGTALGPAFRSAEPQLNQLLLRDAIRDIPRR